ncbi:hypothetical protein [Nocardia sp. NPDC058666]|uniref:hypothetical protein n=1 Tax=Nocardia sp. NPDC058666 TaxID=3346587 RepID=UPI00365E6DFF
MSQEPERQLPQIDYGKKEISQLLEGARNGEISFEEGAVRQLAGEVEQLIAAIASARPNMDMAKQTKGFGGFESAHELAAGFAWKANEGHSVLDQLITGSLDLEEGILRAANMIPAIDEINKSRINLAKGNLGGAQ